MSKEFESSVDRTDFWGTVRREHPDYVRWFVGDAASALGAALSAVPMAILSIAITGDAAQAGIVAAVGSAAYLVMSIPAGIIIDSFDKRRLLALYGIGQLLLWAVFSVLVISGVLNFPLLFTFSLVNGIISGALGGLTNAILRYIVSENILVAAQTRNATRDNIIWLAGSPLGGLLYGLGPVFPFLVQAVCGLGPLWAAAGMKTALKPVVKEKQHWWAGFISDVGYSLRWVWRYPIIRRLFLVDIAFNLATFFLVTAMDISLALRGEPGLIIGIVSTCFSAGLLVGGMLADRIRARWNDGRLVGVAMLWMLAWFIFLMASGRTWWLIGIGAFFLVIPSVACNAYTGSYLVVSAPQDNIGKCAAGGRLVMGAAPAVAAALAGAVVKLVGFQPAMLFCVICLAVAVALAATPMIRALPAADRFDELPVCP